jgi:hypothetical protein
MRPDYCPIGNQPCQSLCDEPCTTTPKRQPLTHEKRVDLLTAFAPSRSSWNAESILIDMVEAAHGIGDKT